MSEPETLRRAAALIRADWPVSVSMEGNWAVSQEIALLVETRIHRAVATLLDEMADHADVEPADGTCNAAALAVARAYLQEQTDA